MRRSARTDLNHAAIVGELRQLGCSVVSLASMGHGVPDLLVAIPGRSLLVEIKSSRKEKLTPDEKIFHDTYLGPLIVAISSEEIIDELRKGL